MYQCISFNNACISLVNWEISLLFDVIDPWEILQKF